MAPHSSPPSSAQSPSLKRKQPTISSFFTQKTPASQQPASDEPEPPKETNTERASKKRPASPVEPEDQAVPEPKDDEEEDEDDIVIPPQKRARTKGPAAKDPEEPPAEAEINPPSQLNGSQRTDLFKFQSSPAVAPTHKDEPDPAEAQRQKEKEKLHQKFVKKLGGADCLVGIGRSAISESAGAAAEEAEEAEGDDEPAPPPTKGKGAAKKGSSKLTPLEKQVIEIKRKHMDTVLVIEVGYKFRFFGEDARTAAKELSIVCIPGKFRFDERMLLPFSSD